MGSLKATNGDDGRRRYESAPLRREPELRVNISKWEVGIRDARCAEHTNDSSGFSLERHISAVGGKTPLTFHDPWESEPFQRLVDNALAWAAV